jgi:gluconolactonase
MRRLPLFLASLVCWCLAVGARAQSSLLPPDAAPEKIAGGFGNCEGPAWHPDGYLLFCNPPKDRILQLDPATDAVSTFRSPSGRATALWFDATSRLVANEGTRRVVRREKDGAWLTLADRYTGKRFNSPNDLTIDGRGRIFFTDPRYATRETMELTHESVYRLDPANTLARLDITLTRPNGIVVTADGKTLIIADNPVTGGGRATLWAFDLDAQGNAQGGRIVHDFRFPRGADGMTLDADDRLWATAGTRADAGIYVFEFNPARSTLVSLGFVPMPETPTNCTFGGPRRDTLYITTDDALYRLRTTVRGRTTLPGK